MDTSVTDTDMSTTNKRGKSAVPLPATNGPRPHRCEICQRSFREMATLKKHEQLHRADRPYVCTTCGKSFLWSSNLKVHERVHTGERPYKCKICQRCFTQSNDLRRHERNVHMRSKMYSYKTPAVSRPVPMQQPNPDQMAVVAYQAYALHHRALLHQALTERRQNSYAMTTSHYFNQSGRSLVSLPSMPVNDTDVSTSISKPIHSQDVGHDDSKLNPIDGVKLEQVRQVTPPPGENQYDRPSSTDGSPRQSVYSPTSKDTHSPPALTETTPVYASMNGHMGDSHHSPDRQKDDRPYSRESQAAEFAKYYGSSYPDHIAAISAFSSNYHSAFSTTHHNTDSVMDLRIKKSISSAESEDGELDWKNQNHSAKTPDSESESDSKRAVTTTSYTPTVDSGIHHCPHCNIFFHDFTMYNLHQSLHSPLDEDPFMCPSCLKHCQDRIEFMFHIVWHVKYPHTIPKYQSFKETYLMVPEPEEGMKEENE